MTDLRELYKRHALVDHACFKLVMALKEQAMQGPSRPVNVLILNSMPLFDEDLETREARVKKECGSTETVTYLN